MKANQKILLLVVLWSLNLLNVFQSDLILAQTNTFTKKRLSQVDFLRKNSENSNSSNRRDKEGNAYREPPKSPDIPYIITPIQGMEIYSKTPLLRWQPVDNVNEYTVKIEGVGVDLEWKKRVRERWWIRYDRADLQAGEDYLLIVETDRHNFDVVFKVVDREKQQRIDTKIARVKQMISGEEEQQLAIAEIYRHEGLRLDEIDILETLIDGDTDISEAYCLLIRSYREIKLETFADSLDRLTSDREITCPS